MNIFLLLAIAMVLIVMLVRRRTPVGISVFFAGLVLWAGNGADLSWLWTSLDRMVHQPRNYQLIAALYFIICLEIILRHGGILAGMVRAMHRMFASRRVTMALMPAFLGLLPSMGGARFSAPIVKEAAEGLGAKPETLAAVNYWFRHLSEYCCPMMTAMILTSGISGFAVGDLILHMGWLSVLAFVLGWVVLLAPIHETHRETSQGADTDHEDRRDFLLALLPVLVSVTLMTVVKLSAPVAMGIAVALTFIVVKILHKPVELKAVLVGAIDEKMLVNILGILYFIEVLQVTGTLDAIVAGLNASGLPTPIVLAAIAFLVGVLCGQSQGHISIVMPIATALAGGDITIIGIAYVFGMAGEMITPTHLCTVICVDYFRCDFARFWRPVFFIQMMVLSAFVVWTLITFA